jgi:predicted ATPase
MTHDNFIVLTGPPGSGKSSLLTALQARGYPVVPEPARRIIAAQRSIEGNGVSDRDVRLFIELLLSHAIEDYQRSGDAAAPVFYDRGIPDVSGYAATFGFDHPPARNAARLYRYNRTVFFAPAWEAIFTNDDERTLSFPMTQQFGDDLRAAYEQSGYDVVDLPLVSVEERAQFILRHI